MRSASRRNLPIPWSAPTRVDAKSEVAMSLRNRTAQ